MSELAPPTRGPKKKKQRFHGTSSAPISIAGAGTPRHGLPARTEHLELENGQRSRDVAVTEFRSKLCDMMSTLEREYEVLYLENEALRKRVDELSDLLESNGIRSDGNASALTLDREQSESTLGSSAMPMPSNASATSVTPVPSSTPLSQPQSRITSATTSVPMVTNVKSVNSPNLVKKLSASSRVTRLKTTYRAGANKILRFSAFATVEVRQDMYGHSDGIWDVASSPVTNMLGTASADRTACIWCTESGSCLLKYVGHTGSVNSIRFHPTAPLVCTASGDGQVHIWRCSVSMVPPGNPLGKSTSHGNMPSGHGISLSPSDSCLGSSNTSGGGGYYTDMSNIANWAQGQEVHQSPTVGSAGSSGVGGSASTLTGTPFASGVVPAASNALTTVGGGGTADEDDSIADRFNDEQNESLDKCTVVRSPVSHLSGHLGVVTAAHWLADGDHIASASWDRTVKLWNVDTSQCVSTLAGHDQELTNVTCHPSEKLVLTSARDTTFRMWDLSSSDCHPVHVLQAHSGTVTSAIFSSKGHVISASDDRTVKVWDVRQMRSPTVTIRASTPVNRISVSLDARLVALPQDNRHVRVFDISGARLDKSSQKQGHSRMVTATTFVANDDSPDELYSVGFDNRLIGWSVMLPSN